jgi:hypothetical protein
LLRNGVAAQSVLIGIYGLAPPLSSNSHVHEYPNITAAYNAVIAQTDPVGFVAMSAICLNGKYPTSGTSALANFPVQASPEDPSMLVNGYNPLTQAGLPIRQRRSQAQNDELASFVAFLTDFTSPPTPDSPMTATLRKYCYSAPDSPGTIGMTAAAAASGTVGGVDRHLWSDTAARAARFTCDCNP